ncbi:hypothetical protein YT1_4623 [Rhodococcus ruber]|nr:hypothetical protein YT1_4623 [Rhodococcus ruber]
MVGLRCGSRKGSWSMVVSEPARGRGGTHSAGAQRMEPSTQASHAMRAPASSRVGLGRASHSVDSAG